MTLFYDYIIVGSGLAGLLSAIEFSSEGYKVALITKSSLGESNSFYAQGGISCVLDETNDSYQQHIEDTLACGAGLCNESVVKEIILYSQKSLQYLIDLGVEFSKKKGNFSLAKEGGHSQRRIVHSKDITGKKLIQALKKKIFSSPNIDLYEHHFAIDLIHSFKFSYSSKEENSCLGVYVFDEGSLKVKTFLSHCTILATGGAGRIYRHTTNPPIATGDGLAMAYRAFLPICNMEFFQFHPTSFFTKKGESFLISEALRGEGAKLLIQEKGKFVEFMQSYNSLGSLASRDVVARAIDFELKRTGEKSVFLDITHLSEDYLKERFPNIYSVCLSSGINVSKDLIPVVPAAHYCCGGVEAGINGQTKMANLFVLGELAYTGFHGANRLASNSLLEALVMAIKNFSYCKERSIEKKSFPEVPEWKQEGFVPSEEKITITHNWIEIRSIMWDYVGIYRSQKRLLRAKEKINAIKKEIDSFYWHYQLSSDFLELRNILTVAELVINSAIERKESRGLHYNKDFLECSSEAKVTRLIRDEN